MIFRSRQRGVGGMISTRGWFPFECHGAGTNLSAKKTGFYFFFFFSLLMGDALFSFSMWKLWESHKATGSASTSSGSAPSSPMAAEWPNPSLGTPRSVTEGNQAPTKPLPWERLAHGASCRADVPGRMQLRRAIAGGRRASSPLAPHQPLISLLHSPMD